jgi:hypothetical protein
MNTAIIVEMISSGLQDCRRSTFQAETNPSNERQANFSAERDHLAPFNCTKLSTSVGTIITRSRLANAGQNRFLFPSAFMAVVDRCHTADFSSALRKQVRQI